MEKLNINRILNREEQENEIKNILNNFEDNKNNLLFKKGIYIYGEPGSGKTKFVTNILKDMNYDIIKYDAGDIRNTSVIEDITRHNMSDKNIMSLFNKNVKKILFFFCLMIIAMGDNLAEYFSNLFLRRENTILAIQSTLPLFKRTERFFN